MPRDEDVEYVSRENRAENSVEELKTLLREQNALLREFGPSMKEFVAAIREGRSRKRGLGEYLGEALVGGKFDGLLDEVKGALGVRIRETIGEPVDPDAPRPPSRRRRR